MLPNYELVGLAQYERLFEMDRWWVALKNLAIFGVLYVGVSMALGVFPGHPAGPEGARRRLHPHHLPLPHGPVLRVTGTAWKWILNPSDGLQKMVQDMGWTRLHLRLAGPVRHGHLLRGDRGRVAVGRFCHGAVSGRTARHRRQHHQGRADRRRLTAPHLLAHRAAGPAPGVLLDPDGAGPPVHQELSTW
jgi:hypothetical protein